jgi:hypothetical protein
MQAAMKMGATREEVLEVILLAGMISNSSVLANAYRIVDEKMAACIPCETKGVHQKAKRTLAVKAPAKKKQAGNVVATKDIPQ